MTVRGETDPVLGRFVVGSVDTTAEPYFSTPDTLTLRV
jgi:hypothetical protein